MLKSDPLVAIDNQKSTLIEGWHSYKVLVKKLILSWKPVQLKSLKQWPKSYKSLHKEADLEQVVYSPKRILRLLVFIIRGHREQNL